ncbi:MAG: ParB/RepB/Spo0J family partition protein [Pseudohongiellaceae bacterium]
MTDKKKLGRGLDALLSRSSSESMASLLGTEQATAPAAAATGTTASAAEGDLKHLPIDLIQRGQYQPRTDMHEESLKELAASIKQQGVMQPIVVRPISSRKYEIIAGERRWRATQLAGLDSIPCIIKQVSDEATIALSLIENIQRENLNPIEEAAALKRLQDEFKLTQQQVADAVGKSRAAVANLVRLMNLSQEVRRLLEQGWLEAGHGKVLLALPAVRQGGAARTVVRRGLSVRHTEALVRELLDGGKGKKGGGKGSRPRDPNIKHLEDDLAKKLGAKVAIQHNAKGRGKLVINYNSSDELDGILAHIK